MSVADGRTGTVAKGGKFPKWDSASSPVVSLPYEVRLRLLIGQGRVCMWGTVKHVCPLDADQLMSACPLRDSEALGVLSRWHCC